MWLSKKISIDETISQSEFLSELQIGTVTEIYRRNLPRDRSDSRNKFAFFALLNKEPLSNSPEK